ncbi:hypothetical protein BELL_0310g00010 [Botrytis elliptica]|uniref:Uncharacterized protein n=1 Tax=Botrytis elliptica TaxID=278938 RepID=A0A4Z1JK28_9HELO|nr:hypothetical protein BELL_0310g00010 [Botrytis elliptica]
MPPRRLLLPKSNQSQPLESNEWNVDDFTANFIFETSGPNIVNVSTANNGRPLRFAPAGFYGQSFGPAPGRGNSSAPDMQPSFPVRGPLTASTSQNDGAERLRQHLMSLRELSVARGLDNVEEVLEPDQSQIKYAGTSEKRPAEETKLEEDGIGPQPARKRRYNTAKRSNNIAKRRAAKFDFPTEIIRLMLRCLISEHQTFESDFCTAVCFALTCRTHWAIFRSIHSAKVPIMIQSPGTLNPNKASVPYRLGDLLINWMSPKYRPLPCTLEDGKMVVQDVKCIEVFVSVAAYPAVGGEKDRRLLERMAEFKSNRFKDFYHVYHNSLRSSNPPGLNWFIPNPFRMGEEWYPATAHVLKHTIFKWKSDCHLEREYHWLRDREEYSRHYRVWSGYKTWMLREWVEAQPEAMAYKRSRGLGENKAKVGMRDGFEMLKLVDVQTKEHKSKVKQVVNAMLGLVEGRLFYGHE